MIHPIVVVAVFLLLFNDHFLKLHHPNWITGKLSDFAGLAFFPILLQALWEKTTAFLKIQPVNSMKICWITVLLTALVFTAIKIWPKAASIYQLISSGFGLLHTRFCMDPTDLFALFALFIPLWVEKGRGQSTRLGAVCLHKDFS